MKTKDILIRYTFATAGFFFVALGIAFSVKANLGISVLNAPPYAVTCKFPQLSLGLTNFVFFVLCMVFQMIILRKKFKKMDLLQLVANFILGFFINICVALVSGINILPEGNLQVAMLIVLSIIISALGISMEVVAGAWMLPADMTVRAIGLAFGGKFSNNKIIMDCTVLAIGIVLCWVFFGNPLGPQGTPIIGWGTLILAIFIGLCMKITTPLLKKISYFKD